MDDLVERARRYATSAHARINQLRKYTRQPYDVHLQAVARLVESVTDDRAMIAASWLHDTVEDTPVTFEALEGEFGTDVMSLVKELTDVSRPSDGNRAKRKALDRQHLAGASASAKTIKLADVIDNCGDICLHDPKFGRTYLSEMKSLLEVLGEGAPQLYLKASQKMDECTQKLKGTPLAADHDSGHSLFRTFRGRSDVLNRRGIGLFTEAFTARDIQHMLLSYDRASLSKLSGRAAKSSDCGLCAIRTEGIVTGYLTIEDLSEGRLEQVRPIDPRQVVDLQTSLADVVHVLTIFDYCFVDLDGMLVGVISRSDMEKPVVRMWLFGIIILLETLVVEQIRRTWQEDQWMAHLSEGRRQKAVALQGERERRGLNADLLDCLQFSDKFQLLLNDPEFLEGVGFQSTGAAKKVIKDLESLRNNLAHGQDITRHDWPQIARLSRRIHQFFSA